MIKLIFSHLLHLAKTASNLRIISYQLRKDIVVWDGAGSICYHIYTKLVDLETWCNGGDDLPWREH